MSGKGGDPRDNMMPRFSEVKESVLKRLNDSKLDTFNGRNVVSLSRQSDNGGSNSGSSSPTSSRFHNSITDGDSGRNSPNNNNNNITNNNNIHNINNNIHNNVSNISNNNSSPNAQTDNSIGNRDISIFNDTDSINASNSSINNTGQTDYYSSLNSLIEVLSNTGRSENYNNEETNKADQDEDMEEYELDKSILLAHVGYLYYDIDVAFTVFNGLKNKKISDIFFLHVFLHNINELSPTPCMHKEINDNPLTLIEKELYPWPIDDMRQFRDSLAIQYCVKLESVMVLVGLPEVDSEQLPPLNVILSKLLFYHLSEVLYIHNPFDIDSETTKGICFLEFEEHKDILQLCQAVEGFPIGGNLLHARPFLDCDDIHKTHQDSMFRQNANIDNLKDKIEAYENKIHELQSFIAYLQREKDLLLEKYNHSLEYLRQLHNEVLLQKSNYHSLEDNYYRSINQNEEIITTVKEQEQYIQLLTRSNDNMKVTIAKLSNSIHNINYKDIERKFNSATFEDLEIMDSLKLQSLISSCDQFVHLARKAREVARRRELESTLSNGNSERLCIICQTNTKTILLLPCKHLCLCQTCSDQLEDNDDGRCPLCRENISTKLSVFA